ncbi:unnamed protein product, partial [Iphiclides podalirius]
MAINQHILTGCRWNANRPQWVGLAYVNSAVYHTCRRRGECQLAARDNPQCTLLAPSTAHFRPSPPESYAKRDSYSPIVNMGLCSALEYSSRGRRAKKETIGFTAKREVGAPKIGQSTIGPNEMSLIMKSGADSR